MTPFISRKSMNDWVEQQSIFKKQNILFFDRGSQFASCTHAFANMRVIFSSGEAHRRRQYRVYGKAAERSTAEKSELDLDLHAGGKLEAHQSLNGLGGGVGDVDQALVGAALELLTGVLILMNSAQDGD